MAGRAYLYFGTLLLPAITSDRHPTDDLRPHAVLEIRRNLLMTPQMRASSHYSGVPALKTWGGFIPLKSNGPKSGVHHIHHIGVLTGIVFSVKV